VWRAVNIALPLALFLPKDRKTTSDVSQYSLAIFKQIKCMNARLKSQFHHEDQIDSDIIILISTDRRMTKIYEESLQIGTVSSIRARMSVPTLLANRSCDAMVLFLKRRHARFGRGTLIHPSPACPRREQTRRACAWARACTRVLARCTYSRGHVHGVSGLCLCLCLWNVSSLSRSVEFETSSIKLPLQLKLLNYCLA